MTKNSVLVLRLKLGVLAFYENGVQTCLFNI